jgi:hypothetical protein
VKDLRSVGQYPCHCPTGRGSLAPKTKCTLLKRLIAES